ncbi:type 3 dihydrofolate reductase [Patescibacteria group bacterium]|nr:type 3 dihydrofolate reductase [Patescibacteria group bacterium]
MIISIIAAVADNMIIGDKNSLPWSLPADMEYFKANTNGKPIIMGAKTFESIGKALPNRKNIILSFDKDYLVEGCVVVTSIEEALKEVGENEEVMIAGGASIYKQFLPLANKLYLTFIHHNFEGDTSFPEIDFDKWKEIKRIDNQADEKNIYSYSFVIFEKHV